MTQITQIHTEKTICINQRDLRASLSSFEISQGLHERNHLPVGGIQHPRAKGPKPQAKKNTPPLPAGRRVVDVGQSEK